MRVPKHPFGFFTAKYKNLQLYPNSYSCFYSKMQNLQLSSNGNVFLLQRNPSNFENYAQMTIRSMAIHSLTTKYEIYKVVPKWPFVLWQWNRRFEVPKQLLVFWPQTSIAYWKYVWKCKKKIFISFFLILVLLFYSFDNLPITKHFCKMITGNWS